jgi:hypothetical protein
LCRRRQPGGRIEAHAHAIGEAEPLQAGAGEHDRVVVAGIEPRQARVDVAAQIEQLQVRAPGAQLRLPAQRRRADARARRQLVDR